VPIYSYKNKKTGKVWDEYLSFKDRTKPLRNKNVEMVITAPRLSFIERNEHSVRDQMIHTARQGMKERQIEEQVGIRKSPEWLQEKTEKHLQKVRNVSS
jgi:hypothetical protein|tara:strand:+ start:103 stop:399 length:297 start_codon:yes stop_codon:yes gene_type:complete